MSLSLRFLVNVKLYEFKKNKLVTENYHLYNSKRVFLLDCQYGWKVLFVDAKANIYGLLILKNVKKLNKMLIMIKDAFIFKGSDNGCTRIEMEQMYAFFPHSGEIM